MSLTMKAKNEKMKIRKGHPISKDFCIFSPPLPIPWVFPTDFSNNGIMASSISTRADTSTNTLVKRKLGSWETIQ